MMSGNPVISPSVVTETALLVRSLRDLLKSLGDQGTLDAALKDLGEKAAAAEERERKLAEAERAHAASVKAHAADVADLEEQQEELSKQLAAANAEVVKQTKLRMEYDKKLAALKSLAATIG
jgi:chromosome segregation ATPase